jgi:adenine deaminase
MDRKRIVDIAAGREPADLLLKGGQVVNVLSAEVYQADVAIAGDRIVGLGSYEAHKTLDVSGQYLCPALIDGHVHIESSMLGVGEFARLVSACGTCAVVADPHEIANVLGTEGIRYMIESSTGCPIDVYIMLSSCVPASHFESAGANLSSADLAPLLDDPQVRGLAEMMNFPGVVGGDPECLAKIASVGDRPVDGHAPGLSGNALCAYVASGVGSDHECTTLEEAREKLRLGMRIMIREGSQARNLDALLPLVTPDTVDRFIFVTDDKTVDDLLAEGHIDHIVRRAIASGMNPIHAVRIATHNAAEWFGLRDFGVIAPGKAASIICVDDLTSFRVTRVLHRGKIVAENGVALGTKPEASAGRKPTNTMNAAPLSIESFRIDAPSESATSVNVIEVLEDRIDTHRTVEKIEPAGGQLHADPKRDLCKIAVIERHKATGRVGLGFVRGFGFENGALASSVGHDAHNLVVTGTNDADMLAAANRLIETGGGFCIAQNGAVTADVPLPIAGLMSDVDARTLNDQFQELRKAAQSLPTKLRHPYMALAFLSLSVIGSLKITDQGLIDVDKFELTDLIAG